jgi:fructosamine-3-kinase
VFDSETFVKTGPPAALDMFEAEAEGLHELAAANVIRVPEVFKCGIENGQAFIAMEKLQLRSATPESDRRFGEQLAALHRCTSETFGWRRDNTIGSTPQINTPSDNWTEFFREHRLQFQLRLAADNGYGGELQSLGAELCDALPALFENYEPVASLLHGDLWSGNWGVVDSEPVIFDPAVYYGDRESDIAMTKLFGGFGKAFYDAYESSSPLAAGHERRCDLYQLYHVLNHLNLFGSGYLGQALSLLHRLGG